MQRIIIVLLKFYLMGVIANIITFTSVVTYNFYAKGGINLNFNTELMFFLQSWNGFLLILYINFFQREEVNINEMYNTETDEQ